GNLATPPIVSTSPDTVGIFWQALPNTLERSQVYFAKVEIEYSGVTYSSGVTFNLRIPTDQEQAQQMLNSLSNITAGVSTLDTNLNVLATAQAAFRASASGKLDFLTNNIGAIAGINGLTNLTQLMGLTNFVDQLSALTNAVGVIGPSGTNLLDQMTALSQEVALRTARILTRSTSLKMGNDLNLLYRTRSGLSASVVVSNVASMVVVYAGSMRELTGGIYERVISTVGWAPGEYVVACSDSSTASDRMVIRVTTSDIDDLGSALGGLTGQMTRVEFALTNLVVSVSNIDLSSRAISTNIDTMIADVDAMTRAVSGLSNLNEQVSVLTTAVSSIGGLAGSIDRIVAVTNTAGQISGMSSNVTRLIDMVGQLGTNVTSGAGVSNALAGVNWSNLTALATLGSDVSNILARVNDLSTNTSSGSGAGLSNAFASVNWSNLYALTSLGSDVSNILVRVNDLSTNIASGSGSGLSNALAGVNWSNLYALTSVGGDVTDIKTRLERVTTNGPTATDVAAILARVNELSTNLASGSGAGVSNALAQVNWSNLYALTSMGGDVEAIRSAVNTMTTNGPTAAAIAAIQASVNALSTGGAPESVSANVAAILDRVRAVPTNSTAGSDVVGTSNLLARLERKSGPILIPREPSRSLATCTRWRRILVPWGGMPCKRCKRPARREPKPGVRRRPSRR
ncbi:MAG: hypothetical protein WCI74_15775, partial [Actinomycetes bacterium]